MNSSINTPNQNIDLTVRVFDSFYKFGIEVDANTYDVVNSYFESVCADNQIARSFTVSLFRIAEQTKVPVLSLLEQVGGQSPGHGRVDLRLVRDDAADDVGEKHLVGIGQLVDRGLRGRSLVLEGRAEPVIGKLPNHRLDARPGDLHLVEGLHRSQTGHGPRLHGGPLIRAAH